MKGANNAKEQHKFMREDDCEKKVSIIVKGDTKMHEGENM